MNRISHAWPFRAHSVVPCTFVGRVALAVVLLLVAGSVAAGPSQKIKVCHVDSETGAVNLIVVSPNSNHLGNPAHDFEGLQDFTPAEALATGLGTEDSNGDGIDDGCETSEATCPCFNATGLLVIEGSNQNSFNSCGNGSNLPMGAVISADTATVEGFPGVYFANHDLNGCGDNVNGFKSAGTAEIDACIDLIAQRCTAIGTPIPTNN